MKSVSHIILATLLSTGTAIAQETIDFDRHDTNSDGFLTDQEWNEIDAVAVAFDDVDADGDGKLSQAEVTAASAVDAESSPEPGADFESTAVTAEDHSMAQGGEIDRASSEEDPTMQGAAVAGSDTSDASADNATASSDAAGSEDEQAGFATTADTSDEKQPEVEATAGAETASESDAESTAGGPQGGLAAVPSDTVADDQVDASAEQPDVEMQNADTAAVSDTETMAASADSDDGESQSGQDSSSSQQQTTGQQGSMQPASQQGSSTQQGKQAFSEADKDGDKRLSQSEVEDAGYDYVVMYFEPLDTNRDSYLDESEWDQGNAGQQAAPGMRDQQDASLYMNGDGPRDTRFERSEYEGDDGAVRFEEDFDTYDVNDDGYLDESEAVETDWVDVNLFEYSDANDDGLIDIGEANDGFMEWGDDEEEEVVTGEDY